MDCHLWYQMDDCKVKAICIGLTLQQQDWCWHGDQCGVYQQFCEISHALNQPFRKIFGIQNNEGTCEMVFKPFKGIFVKLFVFS